MVAQVKKQPIKTNRDVSSGATNSDSAGWRMINSDKNLKKTNNSNVNRKTVNDNTYWRITNKGFEIWRTHNVNSSQWTAKSDSEDKIMFKVKVFAKTANSSVASQKKINESSEDQK